MAHVLKRNRRASAMRVLVTESIAQEGIDLLRSHQVAIDVAEQIVSFLRDSVLYAA